MKFDLEYLRTPLNEYEHDKLWVSFDKCMHDSGFLQFEQHVLLYFILFYVFLIIVLIHCILFYYILLHFMLG